MDRGLIEEQIAYYAARAHEYDAWFFRQGSYANEEEFCSLWSSELASVESALRALQPYGDVLELACGTARIDPAPAPAVRSRRRVLRRGARPPGPAALPHRQGVLRARRARIQAARARLDCPSTRDERVLHLRSGLPPYPLVGCAPVACVPKMYAGPTDQQKRPVPRHQARRKQV